MSDTKQCPTCGGEKYIPIKLSEETEGGSYDLTGERTRKPCPTCSGTGLATPAAEPKGQLVDLRPQDTQNKLRAFMAEYGVASPTWGVSTDDGDFISELAYFIAAERRSAIEDYLTEVYGPRCETTDKEDFPETDYTDPNNGRCITCEMWETYDSYLKEQTK